MTAKRFMLNETSYHGFGAKDEVITEAKARGFKKALIVTDADLVKFGVVKKITDLLDKNNMAYAIYDKVKANPSVTVVKEGVEAFKKAGADYMIAIGGGSAMDTAKAIGAIVTNGGKCEDWYEGNLKNLIAPLICIPTTCGTGSEVTHESIVNNTTTMEKDCIWGPMVSVSVAILDSTVMDKLPGKILASTGMDALTHAVEAYVCKAANPITDAIIFASFFVP